MVESADRSFLSRDINGAWEKAGVDRDRRRRRVKAGARVETVSSTSAGSKRARQIANNFSDLPTYFFVRQDSRPEVNEAPSRSARFLIIAITVRSK